ncbi:unnamed protein product [Linum trigynum]|uniref:Uncharacterized protein n=1 Tax=Linum trigynum TaxID=586398 RepID=A0AAV2FI14_9ROSI
MGWRGGVGIKGKKGEHDRREKGRRRGVGLGWSEGGTLAVGWGWDGLKEGGVTPTGVGERGKSARLGGGGEKGETTAR